MSPDNSKSPKEVINAVCPVCIGEVISNYVYKMQDSASKEISYWNRCRCGVVWQHRYPEGIDKFYGKEYVEKLLEDKGKYSDSCYYYARVYAPLIEELMYGRKLLDVGYTAPYNMEAFKIRGWIPFGIDFNIDAPESTRLIKGDFEKLSTNDDIRYDLVWMNHVLENFRDPVDALKTTVEILSPNGCIFIATPDTDMIFTNSSHSFCYWREHENYIMWNKQALTQQLERLGFDIIMARRNHESRFTYTDDLHILATKQVF